MKTVFFSPSNSKKLYFPLEVVGESNYQSNIEILVDNKLKENALKFRDETMIASLILEDDNKYDPGNAVRVDIDGLCVGYLSKDDASNYREELARLKLDHVIGMCNAAISMSRSKRTEEMRFGVWLTIEPERSLHIDEFDEVVFFEASDARVTNRSAIFGSTAFAISKISSVDVETKKPLLSFLGNAKTTYNIKVSLPSGRVRVYTSEDKKKIEQIVKSLEESIAK